MPKFETLSALRGLTTRNVNKDKIIDEKWPLLFGNLEEINNTRYDILRLY